MNVDITRRALAEFIGTFWLVFGGCGAAIISAGFPGLGIGFLGVAFAFGLTVLTMVYAIGHVSGAHLNPAVSLGLWAGPAAWDRPSSPEAGRCSSCGSSSSRLSPAVSWPGCSTSPSTAGTTRPPEGGPVGNRGR